MPAQSPSTVFFALRDVPERRVSLRARPGAAERYRLFGLDEIEGHGVQVRHNLERERPPGWARAAGALVNRLLYSSGGYGGDFATVLASLRCANAADVIFSTVDTVGIPLVLLRRAGLVRRPIVYTAVGLPERLVQLRGKRMRRIYVAALRGARAIITYAESEAEWLRAWLGPGGPPVSFVPFGVDVHVFRPARDRPTPVDVLSVGADPRRDFDLLLTVAARRPELTFRIVTSADHARALGTVPRNVEVEIDIPLAKVQERFAEAKVVALPVRDNTYTGATTVLLQAMAMAKPVVVSETAAIATGYELEDAVNCRLVEPGNPEELEQALLETVTGADAAVSLGLRARETVERSLSWERYTSALWQIVSASGEPRSR